MRILLSNDDSINAPGINAMKQELEKRGADVTMVAPETEMSAIGHAITIASPLRVRKVFKEGLLFGYGVNGTPADCVKIGVREIMKDAPPDLIVSGLNQGQNVATNIIYSGTVSAATEGVILKLPSVALSLASFVSRDFATAAWIGASIVESVQKNSLPPRTLLNVNIPAVSKDKIKGIKVCRMGDSSFIECFDKRLDLRMQEYFWQGGKMNLVDEDADINYLRDNYVTVTPVHIDLTNHQFLPTLSKWDFNLKLNEV